MSNQVYSNGQHKYYAQPGQTAWILLNTQTFTAPAITPVIFDPVPAYNQGNQSNLSYDSLTDEFSAVEEGLYHISFLSAAQMSMAPNFEYGVGIKLQAGHGAANGEIVALWVGSKALPNAIVAFEQVEATVYLPQGSTFQVIARNFLADTMGLLDSVTRLFIVKIA